MIKKFLLGVKYALLGIKTAIKEERNFRIDLVVMLVVLRFSLFYNFSKAEWAVIILICFLVPSLELLNTAIERSVFSPDTEHFKSAGQAKDTAAGAVLLLSFAAVIIGIMMFLDFNVISEIFIYYKENLIEGFISSIILTIGYIFIIKDEIFKGKD